MSLSYAYAKPKHKYLINLQVNHFAGAWSNNCNDIGSDGFMHNGCRWIYEWGFAAVNFNLIKISKKVAFANV